MTYTQIINNIKQKKFEKIYLLHGEEPYYIDRICDAIIENALEDHERDFNQTIAYGKDCDPIALINEARGYPLMAERRLIVIKEAQGLKSMEDLETYLKNPSDSTIFVVCHKYKTVDGRSSFAKEAGKLGLVFKSEKIKDYTLPEYIIGIAKEMGFQMTQKSSMLLAEFLGNDLSRIHNEINKLAILLEKGSTINEVHIEENIGISKDYNVFELVNAVSVRDVPKAFKIVDYFDKNPKAASIVVITSQLFTLFSRLMRLHFMEVSEAEAARILKMHPYALKMLNPSLKIYPAKKISSNIAHLYEYDLKSKGLGNSTFEEMDLVRELIYKLMH